MRWMRNAAILAFGFSVPALSIAETPVQSFSVGKIRVLESNDRLLFSSLDGSKVTVRIEPGGVMWPPLVIEDTGRVNVGRYLFDAKSGQSLARSGIGPPDILNLGHGVTVQLKTESLHVRRGGRFCKFSNSKIGFSNTAPLADLIKNSDLLLATSDSDMLALTRKTRETEDGRRREYTVKKFDMNRCAVQVLQDLGDPDYLVEMDWSKDGGWWITGSKEQTILRSADGSTWTQVTVNEGIASLFSTYIVNANEIWVAAMMVAPPGSEQFDLAYSPDNGANWIGVRRGDPVIAKMPPFWLEGVRRTSALAE